MSFGFSVGDFLAVAQLAYQLGKALSDTKGAAKEYQELIAELNVVHKVLLQVEGLRAANQLATATVNALLFTVNTTNVAMETFLDDHAAYDKSLRAGGSGNPVKDIFKKGKWATNMPEKASRYTTHSSPEAAEADDNYAGQGLTKVPRYDAGCRQLSCLACLLL